MNVQQRGLELEMVSSNPSAENGTRVGSAGGSSADSGQEVEADSPIKQRPSKYCLRSFFVL